MGIYILYGLIVATQNGIALSDYIYVFKAVIYVVLLVIATPRTEWPLQSLQRFTKAVMIGFLLYYLAQRVVGIPRPIVFIENNYELATIVILYFGAFSYQAKFPVFWAAILLSLCFVSGSRSALGAAVIAVLWTFHPRGAKDIVFMCCAGLIGGVLFYTVFADRLGDSGISGIDRMAFLEVFRYEARSWGIWQYLVGTPSITPLSVDSCFQLQFYQALFSDQRLYSCYSLILHSFILRTVFDHGIAGLLGILSVVYLLFRSSNDTHRVSLGFVAICVANGLSVSALSSGFVILGLCIVLFTKRREIIAKSHY